jgi:hypothetical protein
VIRGRQQKDREKTKRMFRGTPNRQKEREKTTRKRIRVGKKRLGLKEL